jgi:hypothetical protein
MKKYLFSIVLFWFLGGSAYSQISPPGLGKAHTADWFALGIRQKLDTLGGRGWQSMTYVGMGRKSNPNNNDPFYKPAIWVLNQEFYNQFHPNWQYSMALSYRRQDEYEDRPPYEHDTPEIRQEFRVYGRLYYQFSTPRVKIVPILRQEFRKYYAPDFTAIDENYQLRTRVRLQVTLNLDRNKRHKIVGSSEQLFSISKATDASEPWSEFDYRESRFSLYYSYSQKKLPLTYSLGYMNNLVGQTHPYQVHYLAFDIVLENPFGHR